MSKKKSHPVAEQFSDDEMEQIKRYGEALGGGITSFDEEVERHLAKHKAFYAKMRAAETGGSGAELAAVKRNGTERRRRKPAANRQT